MIKQKRGYSLGVLVITIAVMLILTTTVLMSFKGMSGDKDITNFMNDLTEVYEYVKEYYGEKNVLPLKYDNNKNPIKIANTEYEKIRSQADVNDVGEYYYIDLTKLERIHLKDKERGYLVNEGSLKIYVTSPINYQGTDYYTITDEMRGYDKTYNSGDFEVLIYGNPITWASRAKLILSIPDLVSEGSFAGSGWTFKYYVGGPITAGEFKDKGRLFLYGETVEITENGIVSFYVENDEGHAKVVNVVVSMIDEINPTIVLNGDRTKNGELTITDNETGINPDKLLYKIIGYDTNIETEENGRDILFYGTRYAKYIESYNTLKASYDDLDAKISDLKALGSGDDELSTLHAKRNNIQVEINELNSQNRDFNNGTTPYHDEEANIAIYVQDYAGNKDNYIIGVSRNVLLNSNLIDYEAKPLENSAFSIVKTSQYINDNKIYLRIRAQGATHMLITLDESIDQNDISNYETYESSNGGYELDISDVVGEKVTVYAYFTAGEYENGNLIYNSFSDYVLIDKEEPTADAPVLKISNNLELEITVGQKDSGSGIGKVEYGYQNAYGVEDINSYTWYKTIDGIEKKLEAGKRYYIRTRVIDRAGNGPTVSDYSILRCPEERIDAIPNAPTLGSMQAITWNSSLEEIDIDETTIKDTTGIVKDENGVTRVWYDYVLGDGIDDTKEAKWANAKTEDGSYWVWIPRYAYKIIYYTDASKSDVKGYHKCSPYTGLAGYYMADGETETTAENVKTLYGSIDIVFLYGTYDDKYYDLETNQVKSLAQGGSKLYSEYIVHPAFEAMTSADRAAQNPLGKWDTDLEGIWVAKFEASRADADYTSQGTSSTIKVVPSVKSLTNTSIGTMYSMAVTYNTTLNSHLMKNSEWGAVSYLAYSAYGRNGHEVGINQCSDRITGAGAGSSGATYATPSKETFENYYGYKTIAGQNASTTGNIYGVYDMVGGTYEYVAAYVDNEHDNITDSSCGGELGTSTNLNTKQVYSSNGSNGTSSRATDYELAKDMYGDAVYETSIGYSGANSWNSDRANFPYVDCIFFVRGGKYDSESGAGVYCFDNGTGSGTSYISFRPVLCVQ